MSIVFTFFKHPKLPISIKIPFTLLQIVYICIQLNLLRTSDSLNEGLPIKWPEKSFKENDIFSMEKIVGSTLDLSTKAVFSLDEYQLKTMGRKHCFCYSTYRK